MHFDYLIQQYLKINGLTYRYVSGGPKNKIN